MGREGKHVVGRGQVWGAHVEKGDRIISSPLLSPSSFFLASLPFISPFSYLPLLSPCCSSPPTEMNLPVSDVEFRGVQEEPG